MDTPPTQSAPTGSAPRLAFVHIDDVPWNEVIAQLHGERRVSGHEKFLEWNAQRMVVLGRYDPGMVIERHGHASDHLVYLLEGELLVGERRCPRGIRSSRSRRRPPRRPTTARTSTRDRLAAG